MPIPEALVIHVAIKLFNLCFHAGLMRIFRQDKAMLMGLCVTQISQTCRLTLRPKREDFIIRGPQDFYFGFLSWSGSIYCKFMSPHHRCGTPPGNIMAQAGERREWEGGGIAIRRVGVEERGREGKRRDGVEIE